MFYKNKVFCFLVCEGGNSLWDPPWLHIFHSRIVKRVWANNCNVQRCKRSIFTKVVKTVILMFFLNFFFNFSCHFVLSNFPITYVTTASVWTKFFSNFKSALIFHPFCLHTFWIFIWPSLILRIDYSNTHTMVFPLTAQLFTITISWFFNEMYFTLNSHHNIHIWHSTWHGKPFIAEQFLKRW